MVIEVGNARTLGVADGARLDFVEAAKPQGAWAGRRILLLGDQPAFQLSYWCGTCPFVFKRLDGANKKLSLDALQNHLNAGIPGLDETAIGAFSAVLALGTYLPMLLRIEPRLAVPGGEGDYFTEDQVPTWGLDVVGGTPEDPRTPYYRTFETAIDAEAHLYEFVVPMVPTAWNDPDQVLVYRERLHASPLPTAVAVSTLDDCASHRRRLDRLVRPLGAHPLPPRRPSQDASRRRDRAATSAPEPACRRQQPCDAGAGRRNPSAPQPTADGAPSACRKLNAG